MHANGASFFFICLYAHIGKGIYYGSYQKPRQTRFFAFHFLLPFIVAAVVIMHMMALHTHGSSNPLGTSGNYDRVGMHGYFIFKDLITIFLFLIVFSYFVFFAPELLNHTDNNIMANPMSTPSSIVPEW
ncbi:cytochrome b, partial (mitochondrion) [Hanseniaspora uvarum]